MSFFSFDLLRLRERLDGLDDAGERTAMVLVSLVSDGARLFVVTAVAGAALLLLAGG